MIRFFLAAAILLCTSLIASAQKPANENKIYHLATAHNPRRAALLSLIIPGAGQVTIIMYGRCL